MSKPKDLSAISEPTLTLWYRVNEKYGECAYILGVNGLGEVILSKGYTGSIAKGNRQVQSVLHELLVD